MGGAGLGWKLKVGVRSWSLVDLSRAAWEPSVTARMMTPQPGEEDRNVRNARPCILNLTYNYLELFHLV